MDRIGDWSQAELRRFIVNLVLTDPGALPPVPVPLDPGLQDRDVPVWDVVAKRWRPAHQTLI